MTNNNKGLTNVQIINERIKMGNGKHMTATKKGTLPCIIKQANGKDVQCLLEYIVKNQSKPRINDMQRHNNEEDSLSDEH